MGKKKKHKKPNNYQKVEKKVEKKVESKVEPRRPFNLFAGMVSASIGFLIFLMIAGLIMGEKDDMWMIIMLIGLHVVPCLTFWELSYSTKIFGYDLRSKPVPEGIYPIRRIFHVLALVFTNLCAFFVIPGIAVIYVEAYFGPVVFGLVAFGLPAFYFWFKTFEFRLLKKNYAKYLEKIKEKDSKKA